MEQGIAAIVGALAVAWTGWLQYRSTVDGKRLKDLENRLIRYDVVIEDLRDHNEILDLLCNILPQIADCSVVICDGNGLIVNKNKKLKELLGYTDFELIGQSMDILIPEPYRREHRRRMQRAIDNSSIINRTPLDLPMLKKDGTQINVKIQIVGWVSKDNPDNTKLIGLVRE